MIRKLAAFSALILALGITMSKPTSAAIPCSCDYCPSNTYCSHRTTTYTCVDYIGRFCL